MRVLGQDIGCLVGGHSVHNDVLYIGIVLRQYAFDGFSDELALVIGAGHNGDSRLPVSRHNPLPWWPDVRGTKRQSSPAQFAARKRVWTAPTPARLIQLGARHLG